MFGLEGYDYLSTHTWQKSVLLSTNLTVLDDALSPFFIGKPAIADF